MEEQEEAKIEQNGYSDTRKTRKCKRCGEEYDFYAKKCPRCGKRKNGTLITIILLIIAFIAIGALAYLIATINNEKSDSEETSAETTNEQTTVEVETTEQPQTTTTEPTTVEETVPIIFEKVYLTDSEIDKAYSSPDSYTYKYMKISGVVFGEPEVDEDYVYFQMYGDATNYEKNTLVVAPKGTKVKENDYVVVDGMISGSYDYDNYFGATITSLLLQAENVSESNYIDVVSPSLKTLKPNLSINQYGYQVTIEKVEFSPIETRVYVRVKNNGTDNFNLYANISKVVQSGKQYDTQYNASYEYEEVQSDLRVGAETSGVVTYPPLDSKKDLTIYFDASSDNWELELDEYVFNIKS